MTKKLILEVGDIAPDFDAPTDSGPDIRLTDLRGHNVVLYFYPKDDTPGCTQEACEFRDSNADFSHLDCSIIGVSRDGVQRHHNFRAKHDLPFQLVSDIDGAICEEYGVWVKKRNYGREYMGIERSTFLIDAVGVIREIWRKVSVDGHVNSVLEAVRSL